MATLFSMPPRQPYRGPSRKIVLAFDIGTTFSGVSYSILDPGEVPQIKGVTRYDLCYILLFKLTMDIKAFQHRSMLEVTQRSHQSYITLKMGNCAPLELRLYNQVRLKGPNTTAGSK